MTPDEAKVVLDTTLAWIKEEWPITKKVFLAVPKDNRDYRPDPKSRTAVEIVWHTLTAEVWFLDGLTSGSFDMSEKGQPEDVETVTRLSECVLLGPGPGPSADDVALHEYTLLFASSTEFSLKLADVILILLDQSLVFY